MKAFDKEAVHDEKIFPLVEQIIAICREHQIPMLCSFLYGATGERGDQMRHFSTTHQHFGRGTVPEFARAVDTIWNGLPENRAMAFTITGGTANASH
jgi:hypothetical protein